MKWKLWICRGVNGIIICIFVSAELVFLECLCQRTDVLSCGPRLSCRALYVSVISLGPLSFQYPFVGRSVPESTRLWNPGGVINWTRLTSKPATFCAAAVEALGVSLRSGLFVHTLI